MIASTTDKQGIHYDGDMENKIENFSYHKN